VLLGLGRGPASLAQDQHTANEATRRLPELALTAQLRVMRLATDTRKCSGSVYQGDRVRDERGVIRVSHVTLRVSIESLGAAAQRALQPKREPAKLMKRVDGSRDGAGGEESHQKHRNDPGPAHTPFYC